jgi:hypothetical protein
MTPEQIIEGYILRNLPGVDENVANLITGDILRCLHEDGYILVQTVGTHYEGCWKHHLGCALVLIEDLNNQSQ